MPFEFQELAEYNTRVLNGIIHDKEYQKRMQKLQKEYDLWIKNV